MPLNDPSMIAGYEQYKQPLDRELVNGGAGSLNDEGQQLFVRGEGAMLIQGGWFNRAAVECARRECRQLPDSGAGRCAARGRHRRWPQCLARHHDYSERKAEGPNFKFLLRPEILDLYVSAGQEEPSNHKDADVADPELPLLRNQAEWLQTRETIYPFDNIMPQVINDLFYRTNASVFTGRVSPAEEAANELQREYEERFGAVS